MLFCSVGTYTFQVDIVREHFRFLMSFCNMNWLKMKRNQFGQKLCVIALTVYCIAIYGLQESWILKNKGHCFKEVRRPHTAGIKLTNIEVSTLVVPANRLSLFLKLRRQKNHLIHLNESYFVTQSQVYREDCKSNEASMF